MKATFREIAIEKQDILIALLSAMGFDGFEQNDNTLVGFIDENDFDETVFQKLLLAQSDTTYTLEKIKEENWNAIWESNFMPVYVDNFVGIRADFHPPIEHVQHEIRITPKMSFGTGHHSTTYMMMKAMQSIDFSAKKVLDFGTGTGVLAILASKLGAQQVWAIDNDQWSIDNAQENLESNQIHNVVVEKRDDANMNTGFDIILANINKNVILENLPFLVQNLHPENGILLLSGLLVEDQKDIEDACQPYAIRLVATDQHKQWIMLKFMY